MLVPLRPITLSVYAVSTVAAVGMPLSRCKDLILIPAYVTDPQSGYMPLQATCGKTHEASVVDLGHCVRNNFRAHALECSAEGGFGYNCSHCSLSGTFLTCWCRADHKIARESDDPVDYYSSRVDLAACVGFEASKLECLHPLGEVGGPGDRLQVQQRPRGRLERVPKGFKL